MPLVSALARVEYAGEDQVLLLAPAQVMTIVMVEYKKNRLSDCNFNELFAGGWPIFAVSTV
ncbi:hypothetical protein NZ35_25660 [Pseudomonas chlororaphis]|uniref:Uncharacterized protein n=1 Tax=Pseudomonas chlororaphis TaxID=587753 RepID=A0A0A6D3G7_9PSED|nr:hypothetical protein NZ35_25660 [Pseudomonas chlororaphis]